MKTGLVESVKEMPVLQSNIYKPFEPQYKTPYSRWKFSQKNAIALLKKNGCTGGPDTPCAGNSKIFSCPGVGELKFAFTTTSGNPLRALTFEIIQRQLKSVGIEFTPRFISPAVLFGGGTLTNGDWQIVMFTFLGEPTRLTTSPASAAAEATRTTTPRATGRQPRCCNKAKFTADETRGLSCCARRGDMAEDVFSSRCSRARRTC